ncbi:hypothetical protein C9374_012154 [Naegleria lovaniensis]|uniref:Uncharacterized protein n=1 Tax=Naegleria lovaniensis TaxID=51637 RepID=A0AA88KC05_NAELO|nr:uncharacterized protein C9374_012154 [Naegleria lovaniensis]KAG2373415.1 hypothetical protein C9374_012154 [Naegleria lovaniensis]
MGVNLNSHVLTSLAVRSALLFTGKNQFCGYSSDAKKTLRDYEPLTLKEPPLMQPSSSVVDHHEVKEGTIFSSAAKATDSIIIGMALINSFLSILIHRIQELAISQLLKKTNKKKHFCIGAQTGTGKTLSYLLPILTKMKHLEKLGLERQTQRPKVLIIAPTRELASQIFKTTKYLSHSMKFRSVLLRSDLSKSRMKRDLHSNVDVVVATPTIFNELHSEGHVFFSDVRYVVLDEADTLCGKDFLQELEKIVVPCLQRGKHVNEFVQFGFVFATYNANIERFINHYFSQDASAFHLNDDANKKNTIDTITKDNTEQSSKLEKSEHTSSTQPNSSPPSNMLYIIDKDMHKPTLHIQHKFIAMTDNKDKLEYLLERVLKLKNHIKLTKTLVQSLGLEQTTNNNDDEQISMEESSNAELLEMPSSSHASSCAPERVLIFCNTVKSCRAVHHTLTQHGLEASCFHGDMPHERQSEEFDSFSSGRLSIMVATDIASRGLDILNPVDHVVMFDFPLNSIDYMHRAGRTGRMKAQGKVTSLLNRKKEAALAKVIEYSIVTKQPLTNVNVENAIDMYEEMKYEHHKKKQIQKYGEESKKRRGKFGGTTTSSRTTSRSKIGKISIANPTKFTKQAAKLNK